MILINFRKLSLALIGLVFCIPAFAQDDLIGNIFSRKTTSLNGEWQYIIDPYETGFYNYRYQERGKNDREAYWNSDQPRDKTDRMEHGYSDEYSINVPGDWNSQDRVFLYYEGTVWYKKSFDYSKSNVDHRLFLYFGAVNYQADVYLNGTRLGGHKGGFTPFQFEIPADLLKEADNFLVVKVDNKRRQDEVPTLNTDWWNFGGITRDVLLVETPAGFIQDYALQLKNSEPGKPVRTKRAEIEGWIRVNGNAGGSATIEIPELKVKETIHLTGEKTHFSFRAPSVVLWSPENPKLYNVIVSSPTDRVEDKVGFRKVEVVGKDILVNGHPVFLRGICLHEEFPQEVRRAYSKKDAEQLLGWAKELNANMVRLAHYPHNEHMVRAADSLGLFVWSEIPVYWTINFSNPEVLDKAKTQLKEMIIRDRNRASVIIWSVGNETPVYPERTEFMKNLVQTAKSLDSTRLISAALEVHYNEGKNTIDDPLGQYTDLVSVNEYLGWYGGLPSSCRTAVWETIYNKPLFISETGAGALKDFYGDSLTRWSEEYQEWFYEEQIAMMKRMPDNFVGLAPWILTDFRSPRRNNPHYQDGWNRKGLIDQHGKRKKAFYVLKGYYDEMEQKAID